MIVYVLIGGMKGTTWVQIVKAFLLIGGALVMTIWVLAINGFSLNTLLESAVGGSTTDPKDAILGARPAVRREPVGLHLARDRARARHGGPPARADALLHGADRQGGPSLGRVGDLADRRCSTC